MMPPELHLHDPRRRGPRQGLGGDTASTSSTRRRTYASWQTPDIHSAVHSHATTAEELRAEGIYEVLTPDQCIERAKTQGEFATCARCTRWSAACRRRSGGSRYGSTLTRCCPTRNPRPRCEHTWGQLTHTALSARRPRVTLTSATTEDRTAPTSASTTGMLLPNNWAPGAAEESWGAPSPAKVGRSQARPGRGTRVPIRGRRRSAWPATARPGPGSLPPLFHRAGGDPTPGNALTWPRSSNRVRAAYSVPGPSDMPTLRSVSCTIA